MRDDLFRDQDSRNGNCFLRNTIISCFTLRVICLANTALNSFLTDLGLVASRSCFFIPLAVSHPPSLFLTSIIILNVPQFNVISVPTETLIPFHESWNIQVSRCDVM